MKVWLNDEPVDLPESLNLKAAIEHWAYAGTTFAVAINHQFIPQSHYEHTFIQPGDRLDFVTPMQGG
jgi:sulfur carrier protein